MGQFAAIPEYLPYTFEKTVLTFIVPAPNGCNLNCPFCYISKRKEPATISKLKPLDYDYFIESSSEGLDVGAICIQGYEPLLPESFDYTRTILNAGRRLNIPTSLVTNGTNLERWVRELANLMPAKIAVSIDSSNASIHDKTRGKTGAFEQAMRGLRLAAADPVLQSRLTLASILMPGKHERLLGMPTLAEKLGISHWVVTALSHVGQDDIGGPVGDRGRTISDLLILKREAERCGINFVVDDEFGKLSDEEIHRSIVDINALRIRRLAKPAGTFRLLPTGQCSIGLDLLKEVGPHTPVWSPDENAYDFIERIRLKKPALRAVS